MQTSTYDFQDEVVARRWAAGPAQKKPWRPDLWALFADDAGCDDNEMRVYYAWYAEDFDREAAENLDDIQTM